MALPIAALLWAGAGLAAVVRVFHNPHRALVAQGHVVSCSGVSCEPGMQVQAVGGSMPVLAGASGRVISVSPGLVQIAAAHEPVILVYESVQGFVSQVMLGQAVSIGQQIALGETFRFSVFRVQRDPAGALALVALEPASWLAARGLAVSAKKISTALWCEQGRKIQVPHEVAQCGFQLPVPSSFMLLPVSVSSS